MALTSVALTVNTTATLIIPAPNNGSWEGLLVWMEVYNAGPTTVYLGGAGVTTATGRPVATGAAWSFPLSHGDALYGIVASGTQSVIVAKGRQ